MSCPCVRVQVSLWTIAALHAAEAAFSDPATVDIVMRHDEDEGNDIGTYMHVTRMYAVRFSLRLSVYVCLVRSFGTG